MERVYLAKSYPHLPVTVINAKWGSIDRPLPLPGRISVIPDTRFNATKCCSSGFLFPLTVMPRCFNTHSFFSCFNSSRVEILRACAGPNDGRAASFDLILCLRFALSIPRHTYPPSLSCVLPNSLRCCQYLLQPYFLISRFSAVLYFMPNICTLSPAKNAPHIFPCLLTFLSSSSLEHPDSSSSRPYHSQRGGHF